MTLNQWCEMSGVKPTHPTTERGAVSVIVDQFDEARRELFWLSDYVVSSCCGIVIWLLPRK